MKTHRALSSATMTALLAIALVIASCSPAQVIPPPEDSIPVQATADPNTPAYTITVPAEGEVVFDLDAVDTGAFDVFYVEIDSDLPLELRRTSNYGSLVASSSGPAYFASGAGGLGGASTAATADDDLAAQAIGIPRVCAGSCVIRPAAEKLHARIRNTSGASRQVTLYYFGDVFQDDGEPHNNARTGAPSLELDDQGAIELIGDVDFWHAPSRRTVTLTQGADRLPVRAVVVDHNGVARSDPYAPGDTFEVCEGYFVRVTAATANRAAAPGTSSYALSSTLLPSDPDCGGPQSVSITANDNPNSARHNATLGPGESLFLEMSIPTFVRNRQVLYFEISHDLRLELRNAANTNTIASSSSSNFFAAGTSGLREFAAAEALEPQAITTFPGCRGSCVLVEPSSATPAYVGLVTNEGATSVSFDIFLYGADLQDQGEPANDARATAPQLQHVDGGAIETIGDVDYFWVAAAASVDFDPRPGIGLQLHVLNPSGTVVLGPFSSGNVPVLSGEYLRVRAANGNEAAASARSGYFLSIRSGVSAAEVAAQRGASAPR